MDHIPIIALAEAYAKDKMKLYDPGHDWWHVLRVRKLSISINMIENIADPLILDLAAILHDVADSKFNNSEAYAELENFLESTGVPGLNDRLPGIIKNVSFSNKNKSGNLSDPVLMVLQDADRLDAIGAIGIARAFSYGSSRNNPIYLPPDEHGAMEPSTVRHFYDKLLRIKDLMNTDTGRKMAGERHKFLDTYLEQFYREWNV